MKKKGFMEIINKNNLYGNSEDPSKTTFYYVLNLLYFFQCDSKNKNQYNLLRSLSRNPEDIRK